MITQSAAAGKPEQVTGDRMRLTCPNCGAQYEVPDDVIPESGRDVQCSNCGDTWFQFHPDHTPDDAPNEDNEDTQSWDAPDNADEEDLGPIQRKELDDSVTSVLREEADRETRARAAETGGLESQPDLGLDSGNDEVDRRSREARDRMARLRGETSDPDDFGIDPTSRRDLLPDIEEINSSLRSESEESPAMDPSEAYPEEEPSSGGFRRGFLLVIILAAILVSLYVFAPKISAMVPQLDGVLSDYVNAVNTWRVWLDGQVSNLMLWLDSMST